MPLPSLRSSNPLFAFRSMLDDFFNEPGISVITNMMIDWKKFWIKLYVVSTNIGDIQREEMGKS